MILACIGSYVPILVPTWWNILGRIKKYGLIGGGMQLGVGFQKTHAIPSVLSVSFLWVQM